MRRKLLIGLYLWAGEVATFIEDANLAKEDYVDGSYEVDLNEVVLRIIPRRRGGQSVTGSILSAVLNSTKSGYRSVGYLFVRRCSLV